MKKVKTNNYTPDQIVLSWEGQFRFNKERNGKPGLRSPQIGALHALMAHSEESEDSAIVVMPTGTGKTETMLAYTVANMCKKVFVIVPSDALRSQTFKKFKELGILKELGVIPHDIQLPIVRKVSTTHSEEEWVDIIDSSNVIITTMASAENIPNKIRLYLKEKISILFVDEAHHSKAETWNAFINVFPKKNVVMFTATPFRNDGKKLSGRVVFNFSLKKAQEQKYYQQINNYQIAKYSTEEADKAIAEKAISVLKTDLANGFDHIVMARCKSIKRAKEVFQVYEQYKEFTPIIVYSGMRNGISALKAIKQGKHRIIVCVNMLGEGYDLPQLKIAAVHDEKQSLAVTLQFIGRFTRTKVKVGPASFITNIAYQPVQDEINALYQMDADWNYILPRINDEAATQQQKLSEFLSNFHGTLKDEISLEDIRPALSAEIYLTDSTTTSFSNWRKALNNANLYDCLLHSQSNDTLVIVLAKESHVLWGDTQTVHNLNWDIIIVYFDPVSRRIYLNSTIKINGESFLKQMFSNPIKYQDENMFRVFANVQRLRLFNVGTRLPKGRDISFQSYYGSSVQEGIDQLTQGKLQKNNLFGVGFKDGNMISIGCSCKGKVWSRERANLLHFQKWCKEVGNIIADENIDPNVVLKNTLHTERMSEFKDVHPIAIDWNHHVYEHSTLLLKIGDHVVNFYEVELSIEDETNIGKNIVFGLKYENSISKFKMIIENQKVRYNHIHGVPVKRIKNSSEESFEEFLDENPMTVFYADDSISFGTNYLAPKQKADEIPEDLIETLEWENVNLSKESQGPEPYTGMKTKCTMWVWR